MVIPNEEIEAKTTKSTMQTNVEKKIDDKKRRILNENNRAKMFDLVALNCRIRRSE